MSAPLRILTVVHGYPPNEHAGAELAAHWLDRALVARGHDVRVFARGGGADLPEFARTRERVGGVAVTRLKTFPENASELRGTYLNPGVRRLFEEELAAGADVVHFHHTLGLSVDLIEAAKQAGARVVFTLHDFWHLCPRGQRFMPNGHLCADIDHARCGRCIRKKQARYLLQRFAKEPLRALLGLPRYVAENLGARALRRRAAEIVAQLNRADVVAASSRFVRDEHVAHGLDPARAVVVPNGIDPEVAAQLARHDAPRSPLRFGYAGSLLPSKGVDLLLEAFAGLGARGATLAIHGSSPWDGGAYGRKLAAANRDPAIRFHGAYARAKVAEVMASLDVLVLPARWYENAPVSLDEAAIAGIPVIVADHGGMAEFLAARRNGLSFRAGDAASLRAALQRFVDDPLLWLRLREPAVAVPTAAEIAATFERLYRGEPLTAAGARG